MMKNIRNKILVAVLALCVVILSIAGTKIYDFSVMGLAESKSEQHCNDGYWFRDTTNPGFDYGDWVCVNIQNMNYERAVEVCNHEVGHEIFAEECEKNMSKCFEVAENQ